MATRETDAAELDALRAQAAADPALPPFVRRMLADGAPLESIRLDAFGRWWHEGAQVEHPRVRALFHRSLEQTSAGTWVLRVPPYTYPVRVEDGAHFVVRLEDSAAGWLAHLATGRVVAVGDAEWCTDGDTWVGVRVGDGDAWARLVGAAYQTALDAIGLEGDAWVIRPSGRGHTSVRMHDRVGGGSGRES